MLRRIRRRRILLVLLAVVSGAVVLFTVAAWQAYVYVSMPFSEKFRRSKPALDAYAAQVSAAGPSALTSPPSHIGYFNIQKAEPLPHGFILQSD